MEHEQETPSARLERVMGEVTEEKEAAANLLSRRERLRAEAAEKRERAKRQRAELASGAGDGALRQAREAQGEAEILEQAAEELDRDLLPAELRRSQDTARALEAALRAAFDAECARLDEEIKKRREQYIGPLQRELGALKRAAGISMFPSEPGSSDTEVTAALEGNPKVRAIAERFEAAAALLTEVGAVASSIESIRHEVAAGASFTGRTRADRRASAA